MLMDTIFNIGLHNIYNHHIFSILNKRGLFNATVFLISNIDQLHSDKTILELTKNMSDVYLDYLNLQSLVS